MRRLISIIFLFAIALIFWTTPVAAETYTVKMGSDTGELKQVRSRSLREYGNCYLLLWGAVSLG